MPKLLSKGSYYAVRLVDFGDLGSGDLFSATTHDFHGGKVLLSN